MIMLLIVFYRFQIGLWMDFHHLRPK